MCFETLEVGIEVQTAVVDVIFVVRTTLITQTPKSIIQNEIQHVYAISTLNFFQYEQTSF